MKKLLPWLRNLTLISICLFMALMYIGLGRDYLFDWDEGIYATIGHEMRQSKDYLIPTWNSDLWLEKPPAIGWVTALGIALAGENELGVRLIMPLLAGLTLYAIFRIGEKLGGTLMGASSAAMLGFFNLFLSRARTVNTDGMLLAAIAWVSWLLLAGSSPWLVGLVMGLAVMAKGASGILAILIALPLLWHKSPRYLKFVTISFLLTIVPWHLYAYLIHGQSFITPYLLEQVIRRATVPIEFHLESRWFYFNFLYKDLGIGIILVALLSFFLMLRKWVIGRKLDNLTHIIWWVGLPLLLFTLAKTRLSWYILPIYPGIALAIGYGLSYFALEKKSKTVVSILVIGMLAQMLWHGYQYIDVGRPTGPLPDTLQVAKSLSNYPGQTLAMLVSPNERVAEAILPESQTISSSFRYGGAPSVVWYSHKNLIYYYNYDKFMIEADSNPSITGIIITLDDVTKVPPGFKQVFASGRYLGFVREAVYAYR